MFPNDGDGMKDNITDWALERYQTTYNDHTITKEDIFYYTYGVLHSPGYRAKYQNFLRRGIPNIPMAPDFRAFEKAGRTLADLHLNYETGPRYDLGEPLSSIPDAPQKITFGKKKSEGPGLRETFDHSTLIIDGVTIYDNLPVVRYVVNGRTPIGWLTYVPKKSKAGIDRRPFRVFTGKQMRAIIERLVYVGVESDRIINGLPDEFEMDVDSDLVQTGQTTLTGESQTRFRI